MERLQFRRKTIRYRRGLSEGKEIKFEVDEKSVLKAAVVYSVTLDAADYPNLEDWQGEVEFEISQVNLNILLIQRISQWLSRMFIV